MTPEAKKAWRVETPSEGFADRVTSAILRDRAEPRLGRPTRRWVLLAMVACALVAGGAWALGRRLVVPAPADSATGARSSDPESPPANGGALATPPAKVNTVATPLPRPRPSAHPSASASAPPPKVPYPSCRCNAFACDCGPEP